MYSGLRGEPEMQSGGSRGRKGRKRALGRALFELLLSRGKDSKQESSKVAGSLSVGYRRSASLAFQFFHPSGREEGGAFRPS